MYQEGSPGNKIPWWAEAEESSGQGKGSSDDGRVSQLFHSDINSILEWWAGHHSVASGTEHGGQRVDDGAVKRDIKYEHDNLLMELKCTK